MKVERDNNKIIVYLYNEKYNIKIISKVLNILDKYYDYKKESYYIKVYINKYYGMILEIYEDNEYEIRIRIIKDSLFLYEIEDPLKYKEDIYYYDDKYYINPKKKYIDILENTSIIYGDYVYKIIGSGIKI